MLVDLIIQYALTPKPNETQAQLENRFNITAKIVAGCMTTIPIESTDKLDFYANMKVALGADINKSYPGGRPGFMQFTQRAKYDAWEALNQANTDANTAMKKYISTGIKILQDNKFKANIEALLYGNGKTVGILAQSLPIYTKAEFGQQIKNSDSTGAPLKKSDIKTEKLLTLLNQIPEISKHFVELSKVLKEKAEKEQAAARPSATNVKVNS